MGKTYEMLQTARAKQQDGVDVVVGVVETHGRKETRALLDGLEVMPRRRVEYKGAWLEEMDLDAVLARKPQLVLVDELAHTNAPGSRHPKRYLDVEELLNAGIDVDTTVNIQHVESLNDVVAQITRIRVRETVPDTILDRADDIEVIDLTPDDLMQRLREGKVYVPEQAQRALDHYFSPGNLTALRELALRRTAQRVDQQLLTHMQAHAIAGPWAAGERILVGISEDPRGAGLVRYAKRLADRLHAPWTVLSVESRRSLHLSEEQRDRIADTLRLGERLGAEAMTVPGGGRIADDVIAFARPTTSPRSSSARPRARAGSRSCTGPSSTSSCAGPGTSASTSSRATTTASRSPRKPFGRSPRRSPSRPAPMASRSWPWRRRWASAKALQPLVGVENVDLVFMTAVVAVGVCFGLWPSLVAVVTASLCYNFFFIPPVYTFTIADPANVAALIFFAIVAVLVSNLAARVRTQAVAAQARARATEALYAFSRKLAGAASLDDVLWATAYQIASMLTCGWFFSCRSRAPLP